MKYQVEISVQMIKIKIIKLYKIKKMYHTIIKY